eukprot:TRINITY_DN620_c0_g1_i5.p2 TRINITY_DN620_c0_g1~~TRINITY_DN620_c0_g1_i5.p2  ORF type:complete len:207 (-),score=45.50 TRINITY_DN620_c0_g1_i5:393-1013(-)
MCIRDRYMGGNNQKFQSMSDLNFEGRVAIVTGAGRGIGRAVAIALAQRGAKVLVNDNGSSLDGKGSSQQPADEVVKEIKSKGGIAQACYENAVEGDKVVEAALKSFGNVDIVVCSSGIYFSKPLESTTLEEFDNMYNSDLRSAFAVIRAAFPVMRNNSFGRIVLLSSDYGLFGSENHTAFSTVKGAVWGFIRTLSLEGEKKILNLI